MSNLTNFGDQIEIWSPRIAHVSIGVTKLTPEIQLSDERSYSRIRGTRDVGQIIQGKFVRGNETASCGWRFGVEDIICGNDDSVGAHRVYHGDAGCAVQPFHSRVDPVDGYPGDREDDVGRDARLRVRVCAT